MLAARNRSYWGRAPLLLTGVSASGSGWRSEPTRGTGSGSRCPKLLAEAYADTNAILPLLVGWIPGSLIVGVAFGLALLTLWLYQRPMKD